MCWIDNFIRDCEDCMTSNFKTKLIKGNPTCGLYLIGQALYNPFTKDVYYWIKVGQTKRLSNRVSAYRTNSSAIYFIDWIETNQLECEEHYHKILDKLCSKKHRNEWFQINENLFLNLYNNGFPVLDMLSDYDPPVQEPYPPLIQKPCQLMSKSKNVKKNLTKAQVKDVKKKTRGTLYWDTTLEEWRFK